MNSESSNNPMKLILYHEISFSPCKFDDFASPLFKLPHPGLSKFPPQKGANTFRLPPPPAERGEDTMYVLKNARLFSLYDQRGFSSFQRDHPTEVYPCIEESTNPSYKRGFLSFQQDLRSEAYLSISLNSSYCVS